MAVDDINSSNSETSMMAVKVEKALDVEGKQNTIHSGHFMVSRVHDVNNEDDEEEIGSPFSDHSKGFDFINATKETMKTYNFGNQAIDESLTKLFECMTLAYSGKITSPRWKQFRGLHLSQKQRIRLNNLIWREWHNQYIVRRRPMVCQFATPLSDDIHTKPEAVVLEGKYWKRRLDTVTAEYKKWRRYFIDRVNQRHLVNSSENKNLGEKELLDKVEEVTFIPHSNNSQISNTDLNLLQADSMDIDFTNELLFSGLNQPFAFPNPREFSQLGYADFIQPGLIQLQPNLDDSMDVDPVQDFLMRTSLLPDSSLEIPSFQAHVVTDFADFLNNSSGNTDNNSNSGSFLGPSSISGISSSSSQVPVNSSILINNNNNNLITNTNNNNNNSTILMETPQISQPISGSTITFPLAPQNIGVNSPTAFMFGDIPIANISANQGLLTSQNLSVGASPQTLAITPQQQTPRASPSPVAIVPNLNNVNVTAVQSSKISANTNSLLAQVIQQPLKQSPQTPIQLASTSIVQQLHKQSSSLLPGSVIVQALRNQGPQEIHHQQTQHHQPTLQQQQHPQQLVQLSVPAGPSRTNSHGRKAGKSKHVPKTATVGGEVNASGMITDLAKLAQSNKKRDGFFAVPNNVPRKPRTIAPAPAPPSTNPQLATVSSPSSQASYLARLLREGTYHGAFVNVKKESPAQPSSGLADIQTGLSVLAQQLQVTPVATSPPVMTIAPTNTNIQTTIPVMTGPPPPMVDLSKLSSHELSNILSGTQTVPSLGLASQSIMDPTAHMDPSTVSASLANSSSTSVLSTSPVVKRSPSPVMDVSNPSSPFSLLPSSPPEGEDSAESGDSPFGSKTKKAAHLSAEQKRRSSMKTGFDKLQMLVPSLTQNPKVSKATMLQKTAEYCKKLKAERSQMQKEAAILKQEIESLNQAISNVQSQLPETGVPVSRQRKYQMKEMFEEYVRTSTMENWKFWIFSVIMNCLFDSYCNTVSTVTMEEMCRTSLTWLDQSCSLVYLRPNVLDALRKLSTSTSILTEPEKMKDQALKAVSKTSKISSNIKML